MSEKIITLATLTHMRAILLTAMLEKNGIECFMTNINQIKGSAGGVKVNIQEQDFKSAMKILDDFKSSYGKEKEKAVEYMKSIRRILVPVDFSVHSENAAQYALQIANKLKSNIKLVNAYLDPVGTPQTYLESYSYQVNIDSVIMEIEEETHKSLKAMVSRLKQYCKDEKIEGVRIGFDLFKGNAVDVILNQIEYYKPGMIIMGTRGNELEGIRTYSSVTAHLIQKSTVPVLAVPANYNSKDFKTPERVLYATNFDDSDFSALRRLVTIVKPFNIKIYCVHAATEESDVIGEAQLKKIKSYLTNSIGSKKIECGLLNTVDIQTGLEDFIEDQNIDVLAVNTRKRNIITRVFKRSMTRKFLFHSHIPLLVFQAKP